MSDLLHRIKVFVFTLRGAEPHYLLLRGAQGIESFWGPLQGTIGFGEKPDGAVRREVMDEAGILRPGDLIDLGMPSHWLLGDEQVVEWAYGLRNLGAVDRARLEGRWAEFRWAGFPEAYPSLELDVDRAAILRLHTLLSAA